MHIDPVDNSACHSMRKSLHEMGQHKNSQSDLSINEFTDRINQLISNMPTLNRCEGVRCAKKAIAEGILDTPAAVLAVAEKLLTFGI